MRFNTIICAGLLTGMAGSALACDLPKLAVIPAKDQIAGKEAAIDADTIRYLQQMIAYKACIGQEYQAAGGDNAPDVIKRVLGLRASAATDEETFMKKLYEGSMGKAAPTFDAPAN
jgi:hypothetical protein